MTTEEYKAMEHEALDNLQRLHTLGVAGEHIAFVMSRDTYLAALAETGTVCRAADYSDDGEQTGIRSVYQGYDIFIINEESRSSFQPAIKGFNVRGVNYDQLSLGDFVLSEAVEEDPRIFAKMQLDPVVFNDTGLTVCRQYERVANGRVTFADRIRAGQERERQHPWHEMERRTSATPFNLGDAAPFRGDRMTYTIPQPDFLTRPTARWTMDGLDMEEFERQLNEIAATMRRETESTKPKKKKAPPKKDWDERITPEDTKELDEFLNSLARKGTLESAT